jgi:hypothetical protein
LGDEFLGIWSKVLIIASYALVAFVGNLPLWMNVASSVVVIVVVGYLLYRERKGFTVEFVRGNLLYLFTGHVLIFFGLALSGAVTVFLWVMWVVLMVSTMAFDWVAQQSWPFETKRMGVMVLYAVVWGTIFFLIQQLMGAGGRLDESGMVTATIIIALAGLAYIGLALYRFTKLEPAEE